jgi:gamma-glutamyltranspeptidase / glutathione hydrolase
MSGSIAAGHDATAQVGAEILAEGGTAADAAVAASLASCVAETAMTGLLSGGFAIYFEAATRCVRNLDCFVAVPSGPGNVLIEVDVPFWGESVPYLVGPASFGIPGLAAGLDALWRSYGRLPWARLCEPALRLAHSGVELPPAHAVCLRETLAPVYTMNEGARFYSPGGKLLGPGDLVRLPGLVNAFEALQEEGAQSVYRGSIAARIVELMETRGGAVTAGDLAAYEPLWSDPVEVGYCGTRFHTRAGLSAVPETLPLLPPLRGVGERARVLALLEALGTTAYDVPEHTTNLCVADADGNVCVLTSSLGLCSGDWLPGFDLHLNSILGEKYLMRGEPRPGQRMGSMMAPSIALDEDGFVLGIGSAGAARLRTAIVGVSAGVLDEGVEPQVSVDRPRFHREQDAVNAEPGVEESALDELERRGLEVRRWPEPNYYFGGVSLVSRFGAAADPRRNGAVAVI